MSSRNKSIVLGNSVPAGVTNTDLAPIPLGKTWSVTRFGATDCSKASKPSIYRLLFGSGASFETVRVICLTTGTQDLSLEKDLVGDGTKFVRIQRENTENQPKEMPVWLEAFEK
jgi:hypothetical protein